MLEEGHKNQKEKWGRLPGRTTFELSLEECEGISKLERQYGGDVGGECPRWKDRQRAQQGERHRVSPTSSVSLGTGWGMRSESAAQKTARARPLQVLSLKDLAEAMEDNHIPQAV